MLCCEKEKEKSELWIFVLFFLTLVLKNIKTAIKER
jgi:hypothetical protein